MKTLKYESALQLVSAEKYEYAAQLASETSPVSYSMLVELGAHHWQLNSFHGTAANDQIPPFAVYYKDGFSVEHRLYEKARLIMVKLHGAF